MRSTMILALVVSRPALGLANNEVQEEGLLSARDINNIQAAKAYAEKCNGSKAKVGKIHTHVYHIYEGGAGYGLQEHNAADVKGDIDFVFGDPPGNPKAEGFASYYKGGYIAMLHVGVTQWGKYHQCDHAAGSTKYDCHADSYAYAGRLEDGHSPSGSINAWWYSFPAIGKDKEWSEIDEKSGPCMMIRIKAKCLFNNLAKAGGKLLHGQPCSSGCDSLSADQCLACISGLTVVQVQQVWDDSIWNKKCTRYETEGEDDELDGHESTFTNTSHTGHALKALDLENHTLFV